MATLVVALLDDEYAGFEVRAALGRMTIEP